MIGSKFPCVTLVDHIFVNNEVNLLKHFYSHTSVLVGLLSRLQHRDCNTARK